MSELCYVRYSFCLLSKFAHHPKSYFCTASKGDLTKVLCKVLTLNSIDASLVEGYRKVPNQVEPSNDYWLIIRIDSEQYILNLPLSNRSNQLDQRELEFYFLCEPTEHNFMHHPRQYQYQLMKRKMSAKTFYEMAYTSPEYHVMGLKVTGGTYGLLKLQQYDMKSKFTMQIEGLHRDNTNLILHKGLKATFTSCDDQTPCAGSLFVALHSKDSIKIFGEFPRYGKFRIEMITYDIRNGAISEGLPMLSFYAHINVIMSSNSEFSSVWKL